MQAIVSYLFKDVKPDNLKRIPDRIFSPTLIFPLQLDFRHGILLATLILPLPRVDRRGGPEGTVIQRQLISATRWEPVYTLPGLVHAVLAFNATWTILGALLVIFAGV